MPPVSIWMNFPVFWAIICLTCIIFWSAFYISFYVNEECNIYIHLGLKVLLQLWLIHLRLGCEHNDVKKSEHEVPGEIKRIILRQIAQSPTKHLFHEWLSVDNKAFTSQKTWARGNTAFTCVNGLVPRWACRKYTYDNWSTPDLLRMKKRHTSTEIFDRVLSLWKDEPDSNKETDVLPIPHLSRI